MVLVSDCFYTPNMCQYNLKPDACEHQYNIRVYCSCLSDLCYINNVLAISAWFLTSTNYLHEMKLLKSENCRYRLPTHSAWNTTYNSVRITRFNVHIAHLVPSTDNITVCGSEYQMLKLLCTPLKVALGMNWSWKGHHFKLLVIISSERRTKKCCHYID